MQKIKDILKLLRIKHWVKNVLIVTPLFFSSSGINGYKILLVIIGFFLFSLLASSVYVFNDICDVKKDLKHKTKCLRPIAAGKITIKEAYIIMVALMVISLFLSFILFSNKMVIVLLLIYFILNILYSKWLKNVPIIDIYIIAIGFIIRVIIGGNIVNVIISKWLYLTVMAASLFIGFSKRKNEIIEQGSNARVVLKYYNKEFLSKFTYVSLIMTLVFYSLWSIDPITTLRYGNDYIIYTIPLVWLIFMKYCLNIENNSFEDPVDVLFSDMILRVLVLVYVIMLITIIYVI